MWWATPYAGQTVRTGQTAYPVLPVVRVLMVFPALMASTVLILCSSQVRMARMVRIATFPALQGHKGRRVAADLQQLLFRHNHNRRKRPLRFLRRSRRYL